MAFMKPEITEKMDWAAVETNNGTWWVPFDVLSKSEAANVRGGDFEPLLQYTEGTRVYNDQSSVKKGYGVRLSAPGYMDATDWEVYGNLKEAQRRERELIEEGEGDHATKKKSKKSSHATTKTAAAPRGRPAHATKKTAPEPCVDVHFRVFPDGDVIALFPNERVGGGRIDSYQHLGQHGGASPTLLKELRKASRAEYTPLLAELKQIGYCLRVRA